MGIEVLSEGLQESLAEFVTGAFRSAGKVAALPSLERRPICCFCAVLSAVNGKRSPDMLSRLSRHFDSAAAKLHTIGLDAAQQSASCVLCSRHVPLTCGGPHSFVEAKRCLHPEVLGENPTAVVN